MREKEEKTAWPDGIKKTKPRERVLSVLEGADRPLSAMDICAQTEKDGSPVWLSTIYRILELFEQKALVIKTTVLNNDLAVYELNRHQHKHYAVCMGCHKIVALQNCPMERFTPEIADRDFHVLGHKVELFGYCRECSVGKERKKGETD